MVSGALVPGASGLGFEYISRIIVSGCLSRFKLILKTGFDRIKTGPLEFTGQEEKISTEVESLCGQKFGLRLTGLQVTLAREREKADQTLPVEFRV